jgi:hypothetical protein
MPKGKFFKSFKGKLLTCFDILIFKIILSSDINFKNHGHGMSRVVTACHGISCDKGGVFWGSIFF